MNKIINKINIRNIQDLYEIKSITSEGKIYLKDKFVVIYKIDPANIVACNEETRHRIYQAYTTCIRGLPDTFQIMISKEKADFLEQVYMYKQRLQDIQNEKLKIAISKYVNYLEEISNISKLYKTNHYLIIENINVDEATEVIKMFSNLEEFGIKISQVKSEEEAKKILKKFVAKE